MTKVFQFKKYGNLKRKNPSQKNILEVLVAKFRIRSAFPENVHSFSYEEESRTAECSGSI
jgi:hypothetical protein